MKSERQRVCHRVLRFGREELLVDAASYQTVQECDGGLEGAALVLLLRAIVPQRPDLEIFRHDPAVAAEGHERRRTGGAPLRGGRLRLKGGSALSLGGGRCRGGKVRRCGWRKGRTGRSSWIPGRGRRCLRGSGSLSRGCGRWILLGSGRGPSACPSAGGKEQGGDDERGQRQPLAHDPLYHSPVDSSNLGFFRWEALPIGLAPLHVPRPVILYRDRHGRIRAHPPAPGKRLHRACS